MLLPQVALSGVDGLALYPAQPSLQDNLDRRTGALTSTRVDEATYMLERPGDFTLPAIDLAWWNVRDGKVLRTHMDPIVLHVVANPAVQAGDGAGAHVTAWNWRVLVEWIFDHWLIAALALLALGIVAWFAPTAVRAMRRHIARRRSAYLASERWSFAQLRAGGDDPAKVYFGLLDWLKRFAPVAP